MAMGVAKTRILAGVAGVLLGLGGLFTLSLALVLGLAQLIGLVGAAFAAAAILLGGAGTCLYLMIRPDRSLKAETDEMKTAAADALAELPFKTLQSMTEARPMTLVAFAVIVGYALVRGPGPALRVFSAFI